jgi:hypothetical protein
MTQRRGFNVASLLCMERKASFCAIYIENASFYQDRLGTNTGKTQKRLAFP